MSVTIEQKGMELHVKAKIPRIDYLNKIMRANCFPELHALFRKAHSPAKEFTESYSAFNHIRGYLGRGRKYRVIHVGDGAHCRTAAMFAFLSPDTINYSVDPAVNSDFVDGWTDEFSVERFHPISSRIEDTYGEWENIPTLVTFVHAHVNTDEVLANIPGWEAAYTCACCRPSDQLCRNHRVIKDKQDWGILSEKRRFQVITPGKAGE